MKVTFEVSIETKKLKEFTEQELIEVIMDGLGYPENVDVKAKIIEASRESRVRALLKSASYHVETEGDVSLLTMIREVLESPT